MNDIKFSVLMSLYNKESRYNLFECLESLYQQTVRADEVIIVYDGFINEELNSQVLEFQEKLKIKIKKLSKNQGLGRALNYGMKYTSNNIIARMDTDDICLPDRFEKQFDFLKNNPEIDVLGSNIFEFNDETKIKRAKNLPCNNLSVVNYALYKNPINHMSVIFKKNKIEQIGGYKHHLYMEDYNLWLRCIEAGFKIANIEDKLLNVRVNANMLKRRKGLKYIKSEYLLLKLKLRLNLYPKHKVLLSFLIRTSTRLLPICFLEKIYAIDRK